MWYQEKITVSLVDILAGNVSPKCSYEETSDKPQIWYFLLEKKGGRNYILQNVRKEKERLWKYYRLKDTKETWKLNTIPNSRLTLALEEKNAIKDIFESTEKIGL